MHSLDNFHPSVRQWFLKHFAGPTEPQARAWPSIKRGAHTLIAAPTGSGKTLAAFLSTIDDLVRKGIEGRLEDATLAVYVSPLKALSNDIQINLQQPLEGIKGELAALGIEGFDLRAQVRTGDTPASQRLAMTRKPPHILVTTPESLYILLTSEGGRRMLRTVRTLILDEIHAFVGDKRGSHLALSIERLQALVDEPLGRIGLSATQKPIEEVARFLVGTANLDENGNPNCAIIDTGHVRDIDLTLELPQSPLEALMSGEVWQEVYDRLAQLINAHHTTLVFVNTRRMAERVARHLGDRLGDENVTSHHGSLARAQRLSAEQRLKTGELKALVATASLELGIDIGAVDLVCQLGSTRSIATLLQRVGRSGHTVGGKSKGKLFPLSRDELVECAALLDSIRRGELDRLSIPEKPLDILAQQIVASSGTNEWSEDDLFNTVRGAYPYRNLGRGEFDSILRMLAEGFTTRRGRRGAYLHHDMVNQRLRGRRGARLTAITSGGAIPDTADYSVILEPAGTIVGTLNEDFAIESLAGDIFQLGNTSYRVKRVEPGSMRVEDAHGQPPSIPFWLGEAPGRTDELSAAVSRLRAEVSEKLSDGNESAIGWLEGTIKTGRSGAEQIVEYLALTKAALGLMPTQDNIIIERFFDEAGGTQVVIHSPFGSHINRAWGLALRKRFCRKFNFELQAAATEDSIVFSLGPTHSFPLEVVFDFLRSSNVRHILTQALLDAPMFTIRWRWNATRALAVLRWRGGHKVAPQLQRMNAEDLLALVFPDQLACAENLSGEIEVPDHPLVDQTVRDCLEEAMDISGLEKLLLSIENGEKVLAARDLHQPSPIAQEVLTARPYAFLDDAPMEERRTQAVMSRRWLDPETAADLGVLDQEAINRVRSEAWPQVDSADELHDALMQLGFITDKEGSTGLPEGDYDPSSFSDAEAVRNESGAGWRAHLRELEGERRAGVLYDGKGSPPLWVSAERSAQLKALFPAGRIEPDIVVPERLRSEVWSADEALIETIRGRLDGTGPTTAQALATSVNLPISDLDRALSTLECEGFVMRGQFTPGVKATEWCARRLLGRIHRYTLGRLRREIEAVSASDFMRFLLVWQRVDPAHQFEGAESLVTVVNQMEGFEAPATAWEGEILPARIADYSPEWLDALCLSGKLRWIRMTPPRVVADKGVSGPIRSTAIVLLNRTYQQMWDSVFPPAKDSGQDLPTNAQDVYQYLLSHGASFFADLIHGTGLLPSMVEEALGELVFRGLVSSDSFTGLRSLLMPKDADTSRARKRKRSAPFYSMDNAGRWQLVQREAYHQNNAPVPSESIEHVAKALLGRYGVVFRRLLDREALVAPWRDLLKVYRRLEARGEIRGGRFVAGFSGEQFALPDAVSLLRSIRKTPGEGSLISVSGADPLNLIGIVTPGSRLLSSVGNRVLYRDGVPIARLESKQISILEKLDPREEWVVRNALVRRKAPPRLRGYLKVSSVMPDDKVIAAR